MGSVEALHIPHMHQVEVEGPAQGYHSEHTGEGVYESAWRGERLVFLTIDLCVVRNVPDHNHHLIGNIEQLTQ